METLLEVRDITMRFGDLVANDHVSLTCKKGSVISLLGENGAGKTTLMKVIYGMHTPQSGEIWFEGKQVTMRSPKTALGLGIQMVHQHFMLVNHLTVAENIVMGEEPKRYGLFSKKRALQAVETLSRTYGLQIEPSQLVGELSVGAKQRAEILKALYHGAKLLILDEPTAVLTPQETQELFKVICRLRDDGKSVIIITHKLHETMQIADEIYVMRHGKMVGHVQKADTDVQALTRMMVDHELEPFIKTPCRVGQALLELRDLSCRSAEGAMVLRGVGLTLYAGEIYGLAGIEGNGQQELEEILSGIRQDWTGSYTLLGTNAAGKGARQLIDMGMSCIHADRHDRGLLLDLPVPENVMLGYQHRPELRTKYGFLNKQAARKMSEEIVAHYRVFPTALENTARSFSGGNQQKLVVGRELYRNPKVVLIAHPTRGVDIGVSEIIHKSILELRAQGTAILLITADFDELFKLSDRIGVIYEGKIVTEGDSGAYTPNRLGLYMGGGSDETI